MVAKDKKELYIEEYYDYFDWLMRCCGVDGRKYVYHPE